MVKQLSRTKRWQQAAANAVEAITQLQEVQQEYQEWRDNLPENLEYSALGEKLDEVCELDIESALDIINEAESIDLPLGFGRD